MARTIRHAVFALALAGCSSSPDAGSPSPDADSGAVDTATDASADAAVNGDTGSTLVDGSAEAATDAGVGCSWGGAPGECISVSACAALTGHSSYAGPCPAASATQCCIKTPSTADNPPIPAGYKLMQQAHVTADMTTWAVMILHDPVTYPMFSTTTKAFGALVVLARVEWHPPDFQNGVIHRGVTLYEPQ